MHPLFLRFEREARVWFPCLFAFVLFTTWYCPGPIRQFWDRVDHAVFYLCNGSLDWHPLWKLFWAFANTRPFDILVLVAQMSFFLFAPDHNRWTTRLKQMAFIYLYAHLAQTTTHKLLDWTFQMSRVSPTPYFGDGIRLHTLLDWTTVKDASWESFPGDHCVILLLWALFCGFFKGRGYGAFALGAACLLTLPRFFSGAHWLSDVCVGSLSITLVLYTVATQTSLHQLTALSWTRMATTTPCREF